MRELGRRYAVEMLKIQGYKYKYGPEKAVTSAAAATPVPAK